MHGLMREGRREPVLYSTQTGVKLILSRLRKMQGIVCRLFRLFRLVLMISPFSSVFAGTIVLDVTDHTCGHSRCGKPPCIAQKWLEDGRLQVQAETSVSITRKVDVKSAASGMHDDRYAELHYFRITPGAVPRFGERGLLLWPLLVADRNIGSGCCACLSTSE